MDSSDSSAPKAAARRKRGAGFPVVSLGDAAKVLREAGKYSFEHPTSAFAKYMGHSTTNSGAFRQRIAAFRDWKLITGRGDTVTFTDVARTIALPPDEEAERNALQSAFMNCEVFAALHESVAKGQPIRADGLGNQAVHKLRISPSAVDRFTTSFIQSAVTAGLATEDDDQIVLLDSGSTSRSSEEPEPEGVHPPDAADDGVRGRGRSTEAVPVVHQEWTVPAGAVVFEVRLDQPLPADVFTLLGEVVERAENLAGRLRELLAASTDV